MIIISEMLGSSISDPEILFYIAEFIRITVSGPNPETIIDCMIKTGLVPKLLSLLKVPLEKIQLEITGALINIGHANNEEVLRKEGIHLELISLAENAREDICENAIWTLGNIAADSKEAKDELIKSGLIRLLAKILDRENISLSMTQIITWCISIISESTNPHLIPEVMMIIKYANQLLEIKDPVVTINLLNTYMSLIEDQIAMDKFPLNVIVSLMKSEVVEVALTALYTVTNICCYAPQNIIDQLLKTPLLSTMKEILGKNEAAENMLFNTCLILRNLACKASRTIEQLIFHEIYLAFPSLMLNPSISLNVLFISKVGENGDS